MRKSLFIGMMATVLIAGGSLFTQIMHIHQANMVKINHCFGEEKNRIIMKKEHLFSEVICEK